MSEPWPYPEHPLFRPGCPSREVPTWVCDGCMRRVVATEVGEWADYEHVLCKRCIEEEANR